MRGMVCVRGTQGRVHLHARGRDSPQFSFPFAFLPLTFFMVDSSVEGLLLFFFILESPSVELTTKLLCVFVRYSQNALEIIITSTKVRSLKASQALLNCCCSPDLPTVPISQDPTAFLIAGFSAQKCPLPSTLSYSGPCSLIPFSAKSEKLARNVLLPPQHWPH